MTELFLFMKGLLLGFAIAAPVGPIGILCIHRTLADGFKLGFITGMGAALADACYGFIAAFGLTSISSLLVTYKILIQGVGGLFLCYLAFKIGFSKPNVDRNITENNSKANFFISTYFLTLSNPTTILSFIAIFTALGVGTHHQSYFSAILMVIGVFIGSAIWWLFLSGLVSILLHKLNKTFMNYINKLSGLMIFVFALGCFVSIFS